MLSILRSLLFDLFFYIFCALYLVISLPTLLFPAKLFYKVFISWGKIILFLLKYILNLKYEFINQNILLREVSKGPVIIACKHQSAWETLIYSLFCNNIVCIAKQELFYIPLFGWYLKKLKTIFIDRGSSVSSIKSLLKKSKGIMNQGYSILIFPEGTRSNYLEAGKYQSGIAAIYSYTGATVIPVALNSGKFWQRKAFIKRAGTVTVKFLEPIRPGLNKDEFMNELQTVIEMESLKL